MDNIYRIRIPGKIPHPTTQDTIRDLAHKIITELTKNHPEVFNDAEARYQIAGVSEVEGKKQQLLEEIQRIDNESAKSWNKRLGRENEYSKQFHLNKVLTLKP